MVDASEFFKTAAAHIRRGIEAKYTEIADLRRSIDKKEVDTKNQIADLRLTIDRLQATAAGAADDQNNPQYARAVQVAQIKRLNDQIKDMENALLKERDAVMAHVKGLEGEVMGLEQEAKKLESKR